MKKSQTTILREKDFEIHNLKEERDWLKKRNEDLYDYNARDLLKYFERDK